MQLLRNITTLRHSSAIIAKSGINSKHHNINHECSFSPRHWMQCSSTPVRRGKRTAFDWTAVSEANCKVITASRRSLIKGATFYTGRCYHAHKGGILISGETSSWGRRHPHSGGGDYNAIIFPPGADFSGGGRNISVTPKRI